MQEEILRKPNYSRREIITPCSQITNPCACMYASLRIRRCTCFRGGLEVLTLYVHVSVDKNISVHISILSVNVCLCICVYKNHFLCLWETCSCSICIAELAERRGFTYSWYQVGVGSQDSQPISWYHKPCTRMF